MNVFLRSLEESFGLVDCEKIGGVGVQAAIGEQRVAYLRNREVRWRCCSGQSYVSYLQLQIMTEIRMMRSLEQLRPPFVRFTAGTMTGCFRSPMRVCAPTIPATVWRKGSEEYLGLHQ